MFLLEIKTIKNKINAQSIHIYPTYKTFLLSSPLHNWPSQAYWLLQAVTWIKVKETENETELSSLKVTLKIKPYLSQYQLKVDRNWFINTPEHANI